MISYHESVFSNHFETRIFRQQCDHTNAVLLQAFIWNSCCHHSCVTSVKSDMLNFAQVVIHKYVLMINRTVLVIITTTS